MNDEDPSTNEIVMVIVMSFSIMKQVHIKGHLSSMILQRKFTSKTKIRIKIKDTFKNSSKLLVVDLPLLHVVLELLLLLVLWDLAHGNWTCCSHDEKGIVASQKPLGNCCCCLSVCLSHSLSHSSQSKGIPSRPKCNLLSPLSTTTASKFLDGTTIPDWMSSVWTPAHKMDDLHIGNPNKLEHQ